MASGVRETLEFDRRFESLRPRLLAICRSLVGGDAADDVVHDTYLRARDRLSQLRDVARFDAWVARIAVNQCANWNRDRRALGRALPKMHRTLLSEQRDVALRQLIESLPVRERTLIVLHYGYGYQVNEIAALLDVHPANARTILFRARSRISRALREADR
jgi:RNA polymerase sigma-70 factor (ECF subfamily)